MAACKGGRRQTIAWFLTGPAPEEMRNATKDGKPRSSGIPFTRRELLAAHQRALKRTEKMTAHEGFESLVTAGIITPTGKLSPRYGG